MPNLSPEMTYSENTSKPEPEISFDWKTSESVNNLLTVIAEIIAREYVETVRLNPEVFKDFTCAARPAIATVLPFVMEKDSKDKAIIPTLSLPLSGKGGKYNVGGEKL